MTENILIEFTSNTEGITTAEAAVQNLDKSTADQFTKTNTALKERQTAMDKNVAGLAQYTQKIKDAEKAAAGAFSTKGIKEYQDAVSKTLKDTVAGFNLSDQQARKFFKNLQDEAKKGLLKGGNADEMNQYQASLNAATEALKELGNESEVSGGKTQSLKARLRELKQELAAIDDPSNPKFQAMSIEAAELEDRISDVNQQIKLLSSDTRNLDAGIQAVQGIAGAFAAAQGAMALFGAEDKEVQQTLLKVNAAMSILQGIQQVGALLDKNSALNIFLIKTLRLQQAASTTAVAVAEGEAAVGAEALAVADTEATVAQQGLNAAMSANPAGALILVLGTLVGLVKIFIGDTEAAAKAQSHLNDQMKEGIKWNDSNIEQVAKAGKVIEADYKKKNASAKDLRDLNVRVLEDQIKTAQRFEDTNRQAYDDADKRLSDHKKHIKKLSDEEYAANFETFNLFNDVQRKRFALEDELQLTQISNETEAFKERLKNHTAFVEASVLQTREGSRAELVAQIAAIRAKEQEDLQSEAKLPGEIAQIRAQADRDIQKKRQEIRIFDLNQEKLYADAKLQKSVEGSNEELKARVNLLRISANLEIVQAQGNSAKILDIREKEKKDEFELTKTYSKRIRDEELNTRIAGTKSEISQLQIAGADATNEQLLLAKEKLIDQEAQIERNAIRDSLLSFTQKGIALKEIDDKELLDKIELEKNKRSAEINQDEIYFATALQLESDRQKRVLENTKSTNAEKRKAQDGYYSYQFQLIANAHDADIERLNNLEISQKEFDTRELARLNQQEALKTQITQAAIAKRKAIEQAVFQASFSLIQQISDAEFAIDAANRQSNLDRALGDLETKKQKELDVKNITEQQKADIDKKYKVKEAQLKKVAWEKDKQAQIRQAEINGLLAVTNALATVKPFLPFAIIAAGVAAATAAIQVSKIKATQPPQFRKGGFTGNKGIDEEAGVVHGREYVAHAEATKRYRPVLEAMNELKLDEYLQRLSPKDVIMPQMRFPQFEFPTMVTLPKWAEQEGRTAPIDYSRLGKEISKNIPVPDNYSITMDENGFTKNILTKGNRITLRNQRYKL